MNQLLPVISRMTAIFLITFFSFSSYAQSNYAVSFDGVDDHVVIPNVVSSDFTVEYWMKTSSTGPSGSQWYSGSGLVDAEVGGVANDWGTSLLSGKLAFGIGNSDITITSASNVNTGNWVHVAAAWKQSTGAMTLYINGKLEASSTGSTNARTAPTRITIGEIQTNINRFNGLIDEVRIWNTVRTQSQIKANMFNKNLSNSASGLVAYYRMNDGSGTTATNSCTNTSGVDGTLTNGPTWSASPVQYAANALEFDGSSNYVELTNRINIGSSDFTIEAWVYPQSTSIGMVFAQDVCGDAEQQFRFYTNSSKVNFDISDAAALGAPYSFQLPSTANSVPLNTWTHIAATRSGNSYTVYINGVSNATYSTGTNTINNQSGADVNKRLRIGARGGVSGGCGLNYFNGSIDEVRFWNVARTSTQIQQNYLSEIDPTANASLVAYYTFDQGIASGTNTGMTTLIDQAGNNNGTLMNFSLSGATSNFLTQNSGMFVLPLKWISFTAQKQKETVLLQWSTASETNTADFIIEHRTEASPWQIIGSVTAANTSSINRYSFADAAPMAEINYYRIKQRDIDGSYSYSEIKTIKISNERQSFRIVNNPVVNGTLQIQNNQLSNEVISLFTSEGALIWSKQFSPGHHSVGVNRLPGGVYFLRANGYSEKLIVQ